MRLREGETIKEMLVQEIEIERSKGRHILTALLACIEEGMYFGLMCDSAPYISHRDQHALLILHVTGGGVKECLLGFFKWTEKPQSQLCLESWML